MKLKTVTFVAPQPKRMELDKGRSTDAAREDADTPIDTSVRWVLRKWPTRLTEGHKARGLTPHHGTRGARACAPWTPTTFPRTSTPSES